MRAVCELGTRRLRTTGHMHRLVAREPGRKAVSFRPRASSPRNVWFLGQSSSAKEVLRWERARWHVLPISQQGSGVGLPVVLGTTDVWLLGSSSARGSRSTVPRH